MSHIQQTQKTPAPARARMIPHAHPISWWMLVIITLAILMNSIDRIILPTLLPAIMHDFNLTEMQAGWINSLSFFGTLAGAVLFGFLSDYIGTGYRRLLQLVPGGSCRDCIRRRDGFLQDADRLSGAACVDGNGHRRL